MDVIKRKFNFLVGCLYICAFFYLGQFLLIFLAVLDNITNYPFQKWGDILSRDIGSWWIMTFLLVTFVFFIYAIERIRRQDNKGYPIALISFSILAGFQVFDDDIWIVPLLLGIVFIALIDILIEQYLLKSRSFKMTIVKTFFMQLISIGWIFFLVFIRLFLSLLNGTVKFLLLT